MRKVVRKDAVVEERIYLGSFEIWRKWVSGVLEDERETLHVMDGEKRLAMVETKTVTGGTATFTGPRPPATPRFVTRWQYGNHLGTTGVELDDGDIISYEEYFSYGSTSWWAERSGSLGLGATSGDRASTHRATRCRRTPPTPTGR